MKKTFLTLLMAAQVAVVSAQVGAGGITSAMLDDIKAAQPDAATDRALRNALAASSINQLAAAVSYTHLTLPTRMPV